MDDDRHLLVPGGGPAEDAPLRAMRVDDLGPEPSELPPEPAVRPQVGQRADRTDQLGHQLDLEPASLGAVEEVPLGPLGRAGDQRDVVTMAMVQPVDSQERILLRPADDEPGDHVDNAHEIGIDAMSD